MPKLKLAPVLALLLLVGCRGDAADGSPVLPTFDSDGPGSVSILTPRSGELAVEGRCMYLIDYESGVKSLLVFRDGSVSWESNALVLDGQRFEIGQAISVGVGRGIDLGSLHLVQGPDASCNTQNVWRASALP